MQALYNCSPVDGTPGTLIASWPSVRPQLSLLYSQRYRVLYSGAYFVPVLHPLLFLQQQPLR